MTSEIGVAELKRRFSEFLNRVALQGERIRVRRRGRTVAVLVSPETVPDEGRTADKRRGLAAAAGAWEDYPDMDDFLEDLRRARSSAREREAEALK